MSNRRRKNKMARTINEMWGRQPSSVKVDKTLTATLLLLWRCLTDLLFDWAARADERRWTDWLWDISFRREWSREARERKNREDTHGWPWSQQTSKSRKGRCSLIDYQQNRFHSKVYFLSLRSCSERERERERAREKRKKTNFASINRITSDE